MATEYIVFETVVKHSRADLWDLLGDPLTYPRFFSGLSRADRTRPSGHGQSAEYTLWADAGEGKVFDFRLRVTTNRPGEKLVLASQPEEGSWISVTLSDARPGRTRIAIRISKPNHYTPKELRHRRSEIQQWVRDGVHRISDYLARNPGDPVVNRGSGGSLGLNVAKTLVRSGIIVPTLRADLGLRQLNALNKWGFNLAGGITQAAIRCPDQVAIADERRTVTFGELNQRTHRLTAALQEMGVKPGTALAVLARNHSALTECMVAAGKLGVDLVLLNTGLATRQVEEIVRQHNVRMLFLDDEFEPLTQYLPKDLPRISTTPDSRFPDRDTIDELIDDAPDVKVKPPERAGRLIVLTSGTTGTPKGAKRPAPHGWSTIAAILSRIPMEVDERMFIAAPLFHSWGLAMLQLSTPLRATVVMRDRFDPEGCLAAIAENRCTTLIAVPIMLQRILNLPEEVRERYDTSSLRIVASSGSALPGPLVTRFMDTFGDVLYNFYGSTEVSYATTAQPYDLRAAPTTAGYPALGTSVAILDGDGIPLPRGAVGRIYVGNEDLFDGYTDGGSVNVTESKMDTGDLGYLDADGRLFVSGRDDEMIISGGENVFPRPVEEALSVLPQVSEVAVVGVPDEEYGHRLAAYIVTREGSRLDPDMVRAYVHHRLTRSSVPRDVTFLKRLPRNTTGKVLKRLLVQDDFALGGALHAGTPNE